VGLLGLHLIACADHPTMRAWELRRERLAPRFEALKKDARPKAPPGPGDWLFSHPERGESFAEFVRGHRTRAAPPIIEVLPLGDFNPAQERVLMATEDYLSRFFGAPVRRLSPLASTALPSEARRFRKDLGWNQLHTRWVLERLAPDMQSRDTVVRIVLTTEDLYPDSSWNFVFGQASSRARMGVWSMCRFGDPATGSEAFRSCLLRTIKTASHEVGHMLGLPHCVAYECLMNGSNHLEELDQRPVDPCPICLEKVCWVTGIDPIAREMSLRDFFAANGLTLEREDAEARLTTLAAPSHR
jgi:archaemetzincin